MPQYNDFKTLDEALQYTYTNGSADVFVPYIDGEYLKYYWEHNPSYIINWRKVIHTSPKAFNKYKIVGKNPQNMVGPPPPELSPVIKKIRTMHMRQTFVWG